MADHDDTCFLVDVSTSKNPQTFCKISPCDAAMALRYKWSLTRGADRNGLHYVRAIDRSTKPPKQIKLHRLIMNAQQGEHVDHINGDPLDNRRENLRIVTPQQNQFNSRKRVKRSSQFKGVCWHKAANKWRAYLSHNRKQINIGLFDDELEAAKAYDLKAQTVFGEFAHLNLG